MSNATLSRRSRCVNWAIRSMAGAAWMCPEAPLSMVYPLLAEGDDAAAARPEADVAGAPPEAAGRR